MNVSTKLVSVIIATYNSGPNIERVLHALDAQTLSKEQFEVIFVDDGSTDDTPRRLTEYESVRTNVRCVFIENSGWPSKPRNIALQLAVGEYVMFMDHDDYIFPMALEKAVDFALKNDLDILIPKELKTDDLWWYQDALKDGSLDKVDKETNFYRLIPMVPHKLYRRSVFIDNQIAFPERRRALWEDQYVNVSAYRHAQKLGVYADTPFYRWHIGETNTSYTFDPRKEDFWDRLEDIMSYTTAELHEDLYRDARISAIELHVRVRIVQSILFIYRSNASDAIRSMALDRARRLLKKFVTPDIYASLTWRVKVHYELLVGGKAELMPSFQKFVFDLEVQNRVESLHWNSEGITGRIQSLIGAEAQTAGWVSRNDEIVWNIPHSIATLLPPELLVVPDELNASVSVLVVDRDQRIPFFPQGKSSDPEFITSKSGNLTLSTSTEFSAKWRDFSYPGDSISSVWDLKSRTSFFGTTRLPKTSYEGTRLPVVRSNRSYIAYSSKSKTLAIDVNQHLRSLIVDNRPRFVRGHQSGFSFPLMEVEGLDSSILFSKFYFEPLGRTQDDLNQPLSVTLKVFSEGDSVMVKGNFEVEEGIYSICVKRENGIVPTSMAIIVKRSGHFVIFDKNLSDSYNENVFH